MIVSDIGGVRWPGQRQKLIKIKHFSLPLFHLFCDFVYYAKAEEIQWAKA